LQNECWIKNNIKLANKCSDFISWTNVYLKVGTSSIVYPAAMFAPQVAKRGVPVAEFNLETTLATCEFG